MSGQDVLRERAARALWEESGGICDWDSLSDEEKHSSGAYDMADAVIAELGLTEDRRRRRFDVMGYGLPLTIPERRWATLWERIEGDG